MSRNLHHLDGRDPLNADIYIVQECEDPLHCKDTQYREWAKHSLWTGSNKHKGLGIFCQNEIDISPLTWDSGPLELFLPCRINNTVTLLAVWTRYANSPTFRYIGQAWKYLQSHKAQLPHTKTIVCGDFNSNACWDVWDRWWNHSDVVRELAHIGIASLYHQQTGEQQGQESIPTFYLYRKESRPYHIDYAFLSKDLINSSKLSIGSPKEWLEFSDHMPVVFEFDS